MTNEELSLFKAIVGENTDLAFQLASQMHNVPLDLARSVEKNESSGNQTALSPKGAIGRMQLMPGTASLLNVNPHDEIENIFGGVKYLGEQLKRFNNDPGLATAAYNAGPEAVEKHGGIPPYKETQTFVGRVLSSLGPTPAYAGQEPTPEELAKMAGVELPKRSLSPEELAKIAGVELTKPDIEAKPVELDVLKAVKQTLGIPTPVPSTVPSTAPSIPEDVISTMTHDWKGEPLTAQSIMPTKEEAEAAAKVSGVKVELGLGQEVSPLEAIGAPLGGIAKTAGLKVATKAIPGLLGMEAGSGATAEALAGSDLPSYVKLPLILGGGIAGGLVTGKMGRTVSDIGKGVGIAVKGEGTVLTPRGAFAELQTKIGQGIPFNQAVEETATKFNATPLQVVDAVKTSLSPEIGEVAIKFGAGAAPPIEAFKSSPASTPPATNPPKSLAEFQEQLGGVKQPKKGQVEIPDNLNQPGIDPKIPQAKRALNDIDMERSPNIVGANVWEPGNNIVVDYAQGVTNFQNVVPAMQRIFNNITKKLNLSADVVASEKETKTLLGPLFKEYYELVRPEVRLNAEIRTRETRLKKLDPSTPTAQQLKTEIADLTEQSNLTAKEAHTQVRDVLARRQEVLESLGAKYANVRIKTAAEGEEWAQKLIQPEERLAVEQTRKYLDNTKARMQALGMKTLAERKDYVPYIFQPGEWGDLDAGRNYFTTRMWYEKSAKPNSEFLDFISRQRGSKDWFPLWKQSMETYIPIVERKIAFNPILSKWTPEIAGWRETGQLGRAADWASGFLNRNMMSADAVSGLGKTVDTLTNLEYLHYLAGSVSTGVLHLFKLLQTPAWHGFQATAKGLGAYGKALISPESPERALLDQFVNTRNLVRTINQAPGMDDMLKPAWWKAALTTVGKNPIINPVRAVESFDNGVNMFASMFAGLEAGADTETIRKAIQESLMLLNFRGFATPRAFTTSAGRLLGMFQATPTKLIENKFDLLTKALTNEKDIYGNSDILKAIRFFTLLGGTYAAGQGVGIDLTKHLFHIPFTSTTLGGETTVAIPPPIKYWGTAAQEGMGQAAKDLLSYGGPYQKVLDENIPSRYDESKTMQVLGLPKSDWLEEAQVREQRKKYRERYKEAFKESRKTQQPSPYSFLKGLLED